VARRLTAVSLSLLFLGAAAATVPAHLQHRAVTLSPGPLLSGICFLIALFISLALAEDRHEYYAVRAVNIGLQFESLAWKYSVGGYPFVETYAESIAQRLYLDAALELTNSLTIAASGTRLRTDGSHLTESMARLRASNLEDRKSAYRDLRLLPLASEAESRSARSTGWLRVTRISARTFSVLAVILALAQAVDIITIDFVGAAAAGSTAILAWGAMRKYEVEAGEAVTQYERTTLLLARSESISDEGQWSAFVANCEDVLWGPAVARAVVV
jgi:SMODS and SLOG-associating 2TM effector domain 3/SMODS and SLOG-associating 2TM effector domain 1